MAMNGKTRESTEKLSGAGREEPSVIQQINEYYERGFEKL